VWPKRGEKHPEPELEKRTPITKKEKWWKKKMANWVRRANLEGGGNDRKGELREKPPPPGLGESGPKKKKGHVGWEKKGKWASFGKTRTRGTRNYYGIKSRKTEGIPNRRKKGAISKGGKKGGTPGAGRGGRPSRERLKKCLRRNVVGGGTWRGAAGKRGGPNQKSLLRHEGHATAQGNRLAL